MSCYQYLHRQLFHIITKHLTSDVRISEADRKVPASYFLRNYSWSQMSPSPWSIWDESPTRIRSSFHHWALRHLLQSWNRIFLFIFTTSLLFFSNYPVTEVFPSGTFVSLISTEDPLEYKLTSYFHFPHFCYFQNLRLSTGSITFGVTVTPTLSRLNLSLRNLAFYCRSNSTQQKSLHNVTIFFFFLGRTYCKTVRLPEVVVLSALRKEAPLHNDTLTCLQWTVTTRLQHKVPQSFS